jgi:hypothetical protein
MASTASGGGESVTVQNAFKLLSAVRATDRLRQLTKPQLIQVRSPQGRGIDSRPSRTLRCRDAGPVWHALSFAGHPSLACSSSGEQNRLTDDAKTTAWGGVGWPPRAGDRGPACDAGQDGGRAFVAVRQRGGEDGAATGGTEAHRAGETSRRPPRPACISPRPEGSRACVCMVRRRPASPPVRTETRSRGTQGKRTKRLEEDKRWLEERRRRMEAMASDFQRERAAAVIQRCVRRHLGRCRFVCRHQHTPFRPPDLHRTPEGYLVANWWCPLAQTARPPRAFERGAASTRAGRTRDGSDSGGSRS